MPPEAPDDAGMRLHHLLLGGGAALLLVSACSRPGAPAAQPTPSIHDRAVAAWHAVVQCAHQHGFDVPEPTVDEQGNATFPSEVGKPPADVQQACQQYLDRVPQTSGGKGGGPTAADIRMGRQFAACMRQNGLSYWPDPNPDGTFPATPEIQAAGKDSTTVSAMQACGKYLPSGHIYFANPNGG